MHILHHGTSAEAADLILRDGFRAGTYFTAQFDSAVLMGGNYVFSVVLDGEAPRCWEWICPEPVPPERILALRTVAIQLLHYQPAAQALLRREGKVRPCSRCDAHGELGYPDDGHHLLPGGSAWGNRPITVCPDCRGWGDLAHPNLQEG